MYILACTVYNFPKLMHSIAGACISTLVGPAESASALPGPHLYHPHELPTPQSQMLFVCEGEVLGQRPKSVIYIMDELESSISEYSFVLSLSGIDEREAVNFTTFVQPEPNHEPALK